jgi:hypothetical protein
MSWRLCVALGGLLALSCAPASAQGQKQILMVGQDVRPGDHVKTGAGAQQALLSPDGASLTVGPESEVALDKFQYDPSAKRGELALTLLAGSLRFGGGAISKSDDVTVAAGSSQVRIRGATAVIGVGPEGAEVRMVLGERVSVTAEGVTQTMAQADSVVFVPAHKPPSAPAARSANQAPPSDFGKTARDLDNLSRTTSRIIESSTPGRAQTPMGR